MLKNQGFGKIRGAGGAAFTLARALRNQRPRSQLGQGRRENLPRTPSFWAPTDLQSCPGAPPPAQPSPAQAGPRSKTGPPNAARGPPASQPRSFWAGTSGHAASSVATARTSAAACTTCLHLGCTTTPNSRREFQPARQQPGLMGGGLVFPPRRRRATPAGTETSWRDSRASVEARDSRPRRPFRHPLPDGVQRPAVSPMTAPARPSSSPALPVARPVPLLHLGHPSPRPLARGCPPSRPSFQAHTVALGLGAIFRPTRGTTRRHRRAASNRPAAQLPPIDLHWPSIVQGGAHDTCRPLPAVTTWQAGRCQVMLSARQPPVPPFAAHKVHSPYSAITCIWSFSSFLVLRRGLGVISACSAKPLRRPMRGRRVGGLRALPERLTRGAVDSLNLPKDLEGTLW